MAWFTICLRDDRKPEDFRVKPFRHPVIAANDGDVMNSKYAHRVDLLQQFPQRDGKQTRVQFHGFPPVVSQDGRDAGGRPLEKGPQTGEVAAAPSGGRFHLDEGSN